MAQAIPMINADSAAMKLLQSGVDNALDGIMQRWKNTIAAYLYRMLGNVSDAADLAQEVFVKVYFERARFDINKPFGPWVYTIASNLAKNRLRWRSLHRTEEITDNDHPSIENKTDESVLMECLQKLPTDLRQAIILFDIEEYTHEEIAVIIGHSRKTVEARLYKARALLKKLYQENQKSPQEVC